MRKTKDILQQMGFNQDAPDGTKKAFLKHLQKAAQPQGVVMLPHAESQADRPMAGEQLQFDLNLVDSNPCSKTGSAS